MTREQLENHIATVSKDIDILNCRIAEAEKLAKERDRLREKLHELTQWYVGECFRDRATSDMKQCIFAYKGKTKDLLADLQSEIQKAQS